MYFTFEALIVENASAQTPWPLSILGSHLNAVDWAPFMAPHPTLIFSA
jgi:hypothetical protein